jgi:hypothetical protein
LEWQRVILKVNALGAVEWKRVIFKVNAMAESNTEGQCIGSCGVEESNI